MVFQDGQLVRPVVFSRSAAIPRQARISLSRRFARSSISLQISRASLKHFLTYATIPPD